MDSCLRRKDTMLRHHVDWIPDQVRNDGILTMPFSSLPLDKGGLRGVNGKEPAEPLPRSSPQIPKNKQTKLDRGKRNGGHKNTGIFLGAKRKNWVPAFAGMTQKGE